MKEFISAILILLPWLAFLGSSFSTLPTTLAQTAGNVPTNASNLPIGSCTTDIPCANGACCNGESGFCGFEPSFCGAGNCTSNCDAKAECGPFANAANFTCPLSVCCSQFGFCGTTDDFCGVGCRSNCDAPKIPSCDVEQSSATARRIGYYEGWAMNRKCQAFAPNQIAANVLTHVNFAFALISSSFEVIEMTAGDSELWAQTTALKLINPALKVFLSIGGWTFNDPPTQNIFSDMVASVDNTNTFIKSLLSIMESYAFDGVDIDWEYPGAWDRGGIPADKENYVTFMAAIKAAFIPRQYGLSFTAPSSYWYLQNFDLPGLLQHADWVNVMTYDLHGTWDGVDPYIGYVVEAHTNLTEIDAAFQLYWRVGVDPKQMVMGMAFYGRSFTLATSDCTDPGCPWTSGGNEGTCSGNSGTLMTPEIDFYFQDTDADVQVDEIAAVVYASAGNQWVSYDTDQTFAIKMNYANDHCIGGTMIWSVDQDDANYGALDALYPGIAGSEPNGLAVSSDNACYVTECGASSCYPDTIVSTIYYNPVSGNCDLLLPAFLCCPDSTARGLDQCTKRGYVDDKSACTPKCNAGEEFLGRDIVALIPPPGPIPAQICYSGMTAICCTVNFEETEGECIFTECSTTPDTSCPSNFSIFETSVSTADGQPTCASGSSSAFCCKDPPQWENCQWRGTPPLCDDSMCDEGEVVILSDPVGNNALSPCAGGATRQYCCTAPIDFPAPFNDIFPSDVPDTSNNLFHVDLDPDSGSTANGMVPEAGTNSTFTEGDDENSGAFGEMFIESPKSASVSSLALQSNWVITECDARSDQPQQVPIYCSKANSESCQHVFIGGAEHTIVELPKSCGLGPYARISSLGIHQNQSILSTYHTKVKPKSENVYLLSFDYNFAVIPESNGPIYMRADVTDMPGYWDSVVDSPPERRQWLEERGLWKDRKEKRWWGAFTTWLSKITTLEVDKSQTRSFFWSDTWNIFHQATHCDGPPEFDASLDISLTGTANMNARYGFYLQGTVVPPAVTAAYVHFSSDAAASATFTVEGQATVQYDSDTVTFASFGFPGLYYPGLLTVGPSLVLEGYIAGQLSVQGQLTSSIRYDFPPINFALGNTGDDTVGPAAMPSPPVADPSYKFGYSVELSGDVTVHIVPTIQLGISVLGGQLIDAQAYISADLYAGIAVNGSVSESTALEVCIIPHFGLIVQGGVTGNVLFWETSTAPFTFFDDDFVYGDQCFSSVQEPANERRSLPKIERVAGPVHHHNTTSPRGARLVETAGAQKRVIEAQPLLTKRTEAVSNCPGLLSCPSVDSQIGEDNSDNDIYSDAPGPTVDDDSVYRRFLDEFQTPEDDLPTNSSFIVSTPSPDVSVQSCPKIKFDPFPWQNLGQGYWNLASPTTLDGTFKAYTTNVGMPPGKKTYDREHVYEMQLLSDFINTLAQSPALWNNAAGTTNFCTWVQNFLNTPSKYATVNAGSGLSVIQRLQSCQPSNKQGAVPNGAVSVLPSGNVMPFLEGTANGIKYRAFKGFQLYSQTTFRRYSFSKKVFCIRAIAALVSYMNSGTVADQFTEVSTCVKGVWTAFDAAYTSDPTVDAPNRATISLQQTYTSYIKNKVQQMWLNLSNGINTVIGFYAVSANGTANPQLVDLNFGVLGVGTTPVSADDLTKNIANVVFVQTNTFNQKIVNNL